MGPSRSSRARLALMMLLLGLTGCAGRSASPSASELRPIGAGIRGPAGLAATVYAKGPPTVAALAFDRHGRLWMAAAGLEAHARDGVYMVAKPGGPAVK